MESNGMGQANQIELNLGGSPATRTGLQLILTPHGTLLLESTAESLETLPEPVLRRIQTAFQKGVAHGLLHLGAAELTTLLPTSLAYWRDIALQYVQQLCTQGELEQQRERISVIPKLELLKQRADAIPPMDGAEYITVDLLLRIWSEIESAFRHEIGQFSGSVQDYLQQRHANWNLLGRVCFHLAENKRDPRRPFAFLATYAGRLSTAAKVQHQPLSRALKDYGEASDRENLLKLLTPVQKAAEQSPWLKLLFESGEIYHPLGFTPREAFEFLNAVPAFESSGIVVRLPDWWKARRPSRPKVRVTIGSNRPAGVGLKAMLDFDVNMTLDGTPLTPEELQTLLSSDEPLVTLRGNWVEIDREKLKEVLQHWQGVRRAAGDSGITFLEGMQLLAGAAELDSRRATGIQDSATWVGIQAGEWMHQMLDSLRDPEQLDQLEPGPLLRATLRPYQQVGLRWLSTLTRLGLGACLADDMGLGKTIQVISLLLVAKKQGDLAPKLLVVPASLLGNWKAELDRFAPGLVARIAHASNEAVSSSSFQSPEFAQGADLIITTYGGILRLEWMRTATWSLVILDEAQAIKNAGAQQTQAAKALKGRARIVLTGTPVENRLADLWSLFDFINPGLLGSARAFSQFVRSIEKKQTPEGYGVLRALTRPYVLRRLKTDKRIINDLPDKTELRAWCALTPAQAALYEKTVQALAKQLATAEDIQRRGVVLSYLMRFKQICNHPSQCLGDNSYDSNDSGKVVRLRELCEEIASRQEKVLVFTQFQEMVAPLSGYLQGIFRRSGLMLHGGTPVKERPALVRAFQQDSGPPFFVLSLKAGGTGLTLTAASHVIHFDRWWNPAVENQATDRAFRIGQKRNVLVHKFICRGTIEEKIDQMIEAKTALSREILEGTSELNLTELSNAELINLVSLDLSRAVIDA